MIRTLARRLPFYYGWVVILVAFVTMAMGVNARTAFSLLLPPILAEFGWDRSVTAGAFSFGFLISAFASPLLGRLVDARGPKLMAQLGVVATVAGLALATQAHQPWHLYLTLGVLIGAGSVCLGYSGQSLYLPNWFVRRRGLAMGLAFSGVGIGSIVLLPWMQSMIINSGWRHACTMLAWAVLVLGLPLTFFLRKRPQELGLLPDGDEQAGAAGDTAKPASNIVDAQWAAVEWTLARAMRTSRFWALALAYFCTMYSWYAVQVHQTKYLLEVGFSATQAAWALGAVSLAGIPGQIALGHLSDRIGREFVWTLSNLGFTATYLVLLVLGSGLVSGAPGHATAATIAGGHAATGMAMLYLMILLQGLIGYGMTSVYGAIPAEIFEGRHFGAIFGILMLIAIIGGACGPLLTGALFDHFGNYVAAFWLAAAVSLLSCAAIWFAAPGKVRAVAGKIRT